MFRLRTLGGALIEGPEGPLTGAVSQRRRLALLSLVAASRAGVSRDRVVALLWPESDDEHARHALAQLVYTLRRDLGRDVITGSATSLRVDPDSMSSDVDDFGRAIAENQLERAAELYAGPFLDGFHLGGCHEFERWVDDERARLSLAARRTLETLAGQNAGGRAACRCSSLVAWAGRAGSVRRARRARAHEGARRER